MAGILIAGTSSSVGKTTLTIGIMAALKKQGRRVVPFKVGPDYIDPGFHQFVTGLPSYNLDEWMSGEWVSYLYEKHGKEGDLSIVEGVMGLYDGVGTSGDFGSSASMAKKLGTPVILVIDGGKKSTSAAAEVLGFQLYDPRVPIEGVIVNQVSGEGHYRLIQEAVERDTGIPCVGYLDKTPGLQLKSRHLGLIPSEEVLDLEDRIRLLTEKLEKTLDFEKIREISKGDPLAPRKHRRELTEEYQRETEGVKEKVQRIRGRLPERVGKPGTTGERDKVPLGVFRDRAFSFYYEDNLQLLRDLGFDLIEISPIKDSRLPEGLAGLYIGGGYPEVFAKELAENSGFRESLKNALEGGLCTYAECGGLMYLMEEIRTLEGKNYPMTGFFKGVAEMTGRLQRFGYVEVVIEAFDKDIRLKGHEFHRSVIRENGSSKVYRVMKSGPGVSQREHRCGYMKKRTMAGYPHFHFMGQWDFLNQWIDEMSDAVVKRN